MAFLYMSVRLIFFRTTFRLLLFDDCINNGNGCDVHYVTNGTLEVSEMNRFVQSHLDWTDDFRITHCLNEFVAGIGTT